MHRIAAVAAKEARHIRRDPRTLIMAIVAPLFLLLLFGYAITLDIKQIRLAVADMDNSEASRALVRSLVSSGYFTLTRIDASPRPAIRDLEAGRATAALTIPHGFEKRINELVPSQVQVLVDGSESNTAGIAMGYMLAIMQRESGRTLADRLSALPEASALDLEALSTGAAGIDVRGRVLFNPRLTSTDFLVPGLITILLAIVTVVLTSMSIVRERERGTIEVLMAGPTKAYELILGKLAPYVVIALADLGLILLVGVKVFDVEMAGSLSLLLLCAAVFMFTTLSYGLFLSTMVNSQQAAWLVGLLTTMLPSVILSGFIFPIESMPMAIQVLTYMFPPRYFMTVIRGIMLKGTTIADLWDELIPITAFGSVFLTLGAIRFRKRLG